MVKSLLTILLAVLLVAGTAVLVGCESDAGTGALIGTGIGAGIGALVGDTEGALIGAAVGGGAGYMLGNEGDKKKATADRADIRQEMDVVKVKVTNSNGSMIMVPVRRQGVGYVGQRGEYYDHLPTEDELRPVYGF